MGKSPEWCDYCGQLFENGREICVKCGTPSKRAEYCRKCGQIYDYGEKYCSSCGELRSPLSTVTNVQKCPTCGRAMKPGFIWSESSMRLGELSGKWINNDGYLNEEASGSKSGSENKLISFLCPNCKIGLFHFL